MKIWGYWTTLGWSVVAFLVGQFVGFGVLLWVRSGDWDSILQAPFDGVLVTIFIALSNPVTIGVLAIAVRLARSNLSDYFALKWPTAHDLAFGIAALVVLIAAGDALLYSSGRDLVTAFQLQSYETAAAAGWLPAMFAAAIVIAPAGEEAMFRGFLFRGWVRSPRSRSCGQCCTFSMTGPVCCRSSLSASFSAGCAGAADRWCSPFSCTPCSISKALWKRWRCFILRSEALRPTLMPAAVAPCS